MCILIIMIIIIIIIMIIVSRDIFFQVAQERRRGPGDERRFGHSDRQRSARSGVGTDSVHLGVALCQ